MKNMLTLKIIYEKGLKITSKNSKNSVKINSFDTYKRYYINYIRCINLSYVLDTY